MPELLRSRHIPLVPLLSRAKRSICIEAIFKIGFFWNTDCAKRKLQFAICFKFVLKSVNFVGLSILNRLHFEDLDVNLFEKKNLF